VVTGGAQSAGTQVVTPNGPETCRYPAGGPVGFVPGLSPGLPESVELPVSVGLALFVAESDCVFTVGAAPDVNAPDVNGPARPAGAGG
jgi:hypothetical protein